MNAIDSAAITEQSVTSPAAPSSTLNWYPLLGLLMIVLGAIAVYTPLALYLLRD